MYMFQCLMFRLLLTTRRHDCCSFARASDAVTYYVNCNYVILHIIFYYTLYHILYVYVYMCIYIYI